MRGARTFILLMNRCFLMDAEPWALNPVNYHPPLHGAAPALNASYSHPKRNGEMIKTEKMIWKRIKKIHSHDPTTLHYYPDTI